MFKSLSDSLRSLWHPRADEAAQRESRKRKRPTNEGDQDDSDVEVVSVKILKQEHLHSSIGLLSFLKVPMSKMSEWVKRKTVRQDHFFVRPIPADSHWNRRNPIEEQQIPRYATGALNARNGELAHDHLQDSDRLSRPPVHSRNGAHENVVNGDGGTKEQQAGMSNSSVPSSRRSSCSSSRPGTMRRSTVDKCFLLKEKEEYLKLLQQYTTVHLGYHGHRSKADHRQFSASGGDTSSQRKPGLYLPVPSTPSSFSSSSSESFFSNKSEFHQPSARIRVTPSRFVQTSSHPLGDKVVSQLTSSSSTSSGSERFAVPHRPGRALRVVSPSRLGGRAQHTRSPTDGFNKSQHSKAAEPVSNQDQQYKTGSVCDADQRWKMTSTSVSTYDQKLKGTPVSHVNQQLKGTAKPDVDQRLKPTPVSDADQRLVAEGHETSLGTQPSSALNFKSSEFLDEEWLNKLNSKYSQSEMERQQLITEAEIKKKLLEERRETSLANLGKKLEQQMRLFDEEPEVIEELPLPEVPQEKLLPELTEVMQKEVRSALAEGHSDQVLAQGFRLQLTRSDIATLRGLNWLNDEVINFFMNMLMERGEQEAFSKTYAFNTFFYTKLIGGGHATVKRWTRKVDIFAHHYLIIPVHLGVHWCLCMVFVNDKKICYYDSMGGSNNQCLNAVRQYLLEESIQKRNMQLDLSEWSTETVKDIPQQMNGSDCGMFACMYAETLTRGEKITFTQKDMPYFRRRMVYEILKKKLL